MNSKDKIRIINRKIYRFRESFIGYENIQLDVRICKSFFFSHDKIDEFFFLHKCNKFIRKDKFYKPQLGNYET